VSDPAYYSSKRSAAESLISSIPGDYYGVQGVQIVTGCSTHICDGAASTHTFSCDPGNFGDIYPFTGLTLRGVTTDFHWLNADYYWLNADLTEGPLLSLLGLPSDCGILANGAPYALDPVPGALQVFELKP
jgi:hypothetical protein